MALAIAAATTARSIGGRRRMAPSAASARPRTREGGDVMPSLPERLRSLAYSRADDTAGTCREGADELDRRAERIQRLEYQIRQARMALVPTVIEGEDLPPFDGPPETKLKPDWTRHYPDRPGVTLTED